MTIFLSKHFSVTAKNLIGEQLGLFCPSRCRTKDFLNVSNGRSVHRGHTCSMVRLTIEINGISLTERNILYWSHGPPKLSKTISGANVNNLNNHRSIFQLTMGQQAMKKNKINYEVIQVAKETDKQENIVETWLSIPRSENNQKRGNKMCYREIKCN